VLLALILCIIELAPKIIYKEGSAENHRHQHFENQNHQHFENQNHQHFGFQNVDIDTFTRLVKSGKYKFPLKRSQFTDEQIHTMMDNLRNYEPIYLKERPIIRGINMEPKFTLGTDGYLIVLNNEQEYLKYNMLSDMFIEDLRKKCVLYGRQYSPYSYFMKRPRDLAIKVMRSFGAINDYNIIETMWNIKEAQECTNFRSTNVIAMAKLLYGDKYKSITILDPSSGWGDRLIAAIALDVEYTGVDPNTKLKDRYLQMCDFFNYKKGTFITEPFQTLHLDKQYDFSMTSPPYFDLEVYSDEKTQSIHNMKSADDWFHRFLVPYVDNMIKYTKAGGYIVIVINQKNNENYVNKMVEHIINKGLTYYGIIAYGKSPTACQPMFVFKNTI
jgi:hypothetical protein